LLLCALLAFLARNIAAACLIPALLGPALGLDVTLDGVRVGLDGTIAVRGLRGESPAAWTPVRRLSAPELIVRISPWTLLRKGTQGIVSVRLSRVVLDLDLAPAGAPDAPAHGADAEDLASILPAALPALDLDFASIAIRSPDLQAGAVARAHGICARGVEGLPRSIRL
jgi:hypothetical protein